MRAAIRALVPVLLLVSLPAAAALAQDHVGVPASGELYFTTFQNQGTCANACTTNVWKVSYSYDGNTQFTLGTPAGVATTPGADGIVFQPGSATNLLVGGQSTGKVFVVNSGTGSFTGVDSGISADYHLTVGPTGTHVYTAGLPGTLTELAANPLGTGTPLTLTGDDTQITELAFVPGMSNMAFYTSSGSGGNGNFGELNLRTMVTTRLMANLPAAHGIIFDPYTGDLILSGANEIAQIDPNNPSVILSSYTDQTSNTQFDQAAVDGAGHLFVASNNDGNMLFMDYSHSRLVGSPGFETEQFLARSLDDLVNQLPEVPFTAALPLVAIPVVYWMRRRRRRISVA